MAQGLPRGEGFLKGAPLPGLGRAQGLTRHEYDISGWRLHQPVVKDRVLLTPGDPDTDMYTGHEHGHRGRARPNTHTHTQAPKGIG